MAAAGPISARPPVVIDREKVGTVVLNVESEQFLFF
jgi:hypothetical protein